MSRGVWLAIAVLGATQAAAAADDDPPLAIVATVAAPVIVVSSRFEKEKRASDLLVTIKNASKKDVRIVEYVLGWPDCPGQRRKPLPPIISYGSRSGPTQQPPLKPGDQGTVKIDGHTLRDMARWAKKHGCSDTARPEFALMKVVFGDGTDWALQ